jgi:hypothetical protein
MNITSKSLFMWWNKNYKYFIDYPHDPSCKVFYKFPIHKYIHVLIFESLKAIYQSLKTQKSTLKQNKRTHEFAK